MKTLHGNRAAPRSRRRTLPAGKDVERAYVSSVQYPSGSKSQRDRIEEIGHLENNVVASVGAHVPKQVVMKRAKHPVSPVKKPQLKIAA
jgi:hypothetical protein